MKKMIGLLLAALMLLCGCARREQAPQTEPVTLRVVTSFGSEDGNRRNFEAAVAAYEASTGNLVSDGSDVSSEEWKARVLTDFETGSEPDVLFFFTNADAEPFVRAGKVVPLDEIRAEYPNYAKTWTMQSFLLPPTANVTPFRLWAIGKACLSTKRFWSAAASRCRARIIHGSSSLRIVRRSAAMGSRPLHAL